jgi:phospholipid-binding lipoprotein MlaA
VRRRTGRVLLWMIAVLVSIELTHRTHVSGASVTSSPTPDHGSQSRVREPTGTPQAAQPSQSRATFESFRTGVSDANIPPEALQLLARQHGVPVTELAQAAPLGDDAFEDDVFDDGFLEYDPWERFNRTMFNFNQRVDRYVLKPVARVWNFIVPELMQQSLSNAFDNVAMPRRFVNSLLQLKIEGAGRELARFFINISMGVGGFFDPATEFGIRRSDEDFGQTLGYWGVGPGPFLVLPLLPPLTVRDGVGFAADAATQPLSYIAPFEASVGMRGSQMVNDRSLNLETFEEFEQATFDLYTAVRNAYLQRRQRLIEE